MRTRPTDEGADAAVGSAEFAGRVGNTNGGGTTGDDVGVTARGAVVDGAGVSMRDAGGGGTAATAAAGGLAVDGTAAGGIAMDGIGPGNAADDPAIPGGGVAGSGAPDLAAVPRAAGIGVVWRDTVASARRGEAGLGGADGDSIAITTVNPTNPIRTAAAP